MTVVVTGTTCGLPHAVLGQCGIPHVPQVVIFGEQSFHDCVLQADAVNDARELAAELVTCLSVPEPPL